MSLANKLTCSFILLMSTVLGCATLKSSPLPPAQRCPSSINMNDCASLLLNSKAIVQIEIPAKVTFPISPITAKIVQTVKKLGLPFELPQHGHLPDADLIGTELTLTQFLDAYKSFPGGVELLSILEDPKDLSEEEIKTELNRWLERFIPGYKFAWWPRGETTFIPEDTFFAAVDKKQIPLANHHDLIVHLFLFADPQLRHFTERIARMYVKALAYEKVHEKTEQAVSHIGLKYTRILNKLWVKTQEHTPIQYKDSLGRQRLAILGGYPSVVDPIQSYLGTIIDWQYTSDLGVLYQSLNVRLKNADFAEQSAEAQKRMNKIVAHIREMLGLSENTEPNTTFARLESASDQIVAEFENISARTTTYDNRWLMFSQRVLNNEGNRRLQALRIEHHRELIRLSLELLELKFPH